MPCKCISWQPIEGDEEGKMEPTPVEACIVITRGGATYLCGFAMLNGGCKYDLCPKSSLENCADCGYLEEIEGSKYGKCEKDFTIPRSIQRSKVGGLI